MLNFTEGSRDVGGLKKNYIYLREESQIGECNLLPKSEKVITFLYQNWESQETPYIIMKLK